LIIVQTTGPSENPAHLQVDPGGPGARQDALALGHRHRHRLLQQDRLAGLGRRKRYLLMGRIRGRDHHGVDVGTIQHRPPVGRDLGDAVAPGKRVCARGGARGDHAHIRATRRRQAVQVIGADQAGADHPDAYGIHAGRPQGFQVPWVSTSAGSASASGTV
jgi:hypothetical protein